MLLVLLLWDRVLAVHAYCEKQKKARIFASFILNHFLQRFTKTSTVCYPRIVFSRRTRSRRHGSYEDGQS